MVDYDLNRPWLSLDDWQTRYVNTEGNCFVCCGRQSGKTAAVSVKFGEKAVKNAKQTILMIALTEKQAYNLFFKTLMYLQELYLSLDLLKLLPDPYFHFSF